jgi:ABC-type antimicrobial peptide transport system permease subunit
VEGEPGFEVVGVVADARTTWIEREQPLMVYLPYWWRTRPAVSLLVRTAADPLLLLPSVRRALHEVDPEIAIGEAKPMNDLVNAAMAGRRYQTRLFVTFGLTALLIATLGVYAVAAHGIARRRREMNIRVALGARTTQVVRLMLGQGMTPVLAGAMAGIAGALVTGRLVASLLFEVRADDPGIVAGVAGFVLLVGLVTCLIAARQGLAIDPARALREN